MGLRGWRPSERPIAEQRASARGQALAELAIVAPVMALILVAIVQFAFIFERQIGIENAVRDAARRAATFTTNASNASGNASLVLNLLETANLPNAEGYSYSNLDWAKVCYSTQTDASNFTSVLVTVSMRYRHPLFLPVITQILDGVDGKTDNAFAAQTSSSFTVQNDATTNASVGGTPVGAVDSSVTPAPTCP